MRRPALLPSLAFAALAFAAASCAPQPPPACFADDVIFGGEADDETVAELAVLDCTTGDLLVEDTEVEELSFPLLEEVGGALVVSFNIALRRVSLPALQAVGELLEVSANPVLEEVALPALGSVGGDLVVSGNESLPLAATESALAGVDVGGERSFSP